MSLSAPIVGEKIITAREMARVEGLAFARGVNPEKFMDNAGKGIAYQVEQFIESSKVKPKVTLLVGKGNNGGDAYTAGIELLHKGIATEAIHLYSFDLCGPLCQAKAKAFQSAGGKIQIMHQDGEFPFPKEGVILDGLVGTGFRGKAEDLMAKAIEVANATGLPIIAIDIPSGVNGTTGEVGSVAIRATLTIYLGSLKMGFFLGEGYDHIGKLVKVDFGFGPQDVEKLQEVAILYNTAHWASLLPPISRTQHKYQRGYLLVWAGSQAMAGAAMLTCMGALRGGAGIVRLFHDPSMEHATISAPWEIIKEPITDVEAIQKESLRAGCMVIGPGLGRESRVGEFLEKLLGKLDIPVVIDGDALYHLVAHPSCRLPKTTILTPHRGELMMLLQEAVSSDLFLQKVQAYVEEKKVTLICKGAPTIVFHPGHKPVVLPVGDPGMATAGSGDVLSGVVGAMCAAKLPVLEAAIAAVCLHGKAGEIAAHQKSSRDLIASDLLEALPLAFRQQQF